MTLPRAADPALLTAIGGLVLVVVVPVAHVGMVLVDVIDVAPMLDARVPAVRPVAGMNFVLGDGHYSSLL
jgi:hypothetical protein